MPPSAPRGLHARPADSAACREMIRVGSRSFFLASLLLPDQIREAAYALYGFCRLSDDAVDVDGGSLQAVSRLRARLTRIYASDPSPEPVDRALADAVLRFGLPRVAMEALFEGLEWDAQGRRYETLSDVTAYAARVAGSVGAMMAALMGARTPELVARACDMGLAMQLTNIARDVGEDARAGRLYLTRAWLREAGVDPDAWLAAPVYRPEIGEVVARLLRHADELYARADGGVSHLDPAFRPAIRAARRHYTEIGARLAAKGLDSISRRTVVPTWRKAWLLAGAVLGARERPPLSAAPPLPETRFLVEAVILETASLPAHAAGRPGLERDISWLVDLFTVLERRGAVRA